MYYLHTINKLFWLAIFSSGGGQKRYGTFDYGTEVWQIILIIVHVEPQHQKKTNCLFLEVVKDENGKYFHFHICFNYNFHPRSKNRGNESLCKKFQQST